MHALNRFWLFFIQNRLHIILSSLAILWCWSEFLAIQVRSIDYIILPIVVACISEWNRLTDQIEDEVNCPEDLVDARRKQSIIRAFCYSAGSLTIILAVLTDPSWPVICLTAIGAAIGYFYNSPIMPSRPHMRIKNLLLFKNLSSAVGWSLGILVFPALRAHAALDIRFWVAFTYMFIMVITYEIMWDIRDQKGDFEAGIITLPMVMGLSGTRLLTIVLQVFAIGNISLGIYLGIIGMSWTIFILPSLAMIMIVALIDLETNRILSHILVLGSAVFSLLGGWIAP